LIDDSIENALQCATHSEPTPVLLFGDYEWNKRRSVPEDNCEDMTYDIRVRREGPEFWTKEEFEIPANTPVYRARDWASVIRWVQIACKEGKL
jgi:hypothetical protein